MAMGKSAVRMKLLSGDALCIQESSMNRSYGSGIGTGVKTLTHTIHFEGDTFMEIDRNGSAVTDIFRQTASCRAKEVGNVRGSEASINSCYVTLIEHQYVDCECARL